MVQNENDIDMEGKTKKLSPTWAFIFVILFCVIETTCCAAIWLAVIYMWKNQ